MGSRKESAKTLNSTLKSIGGELKNAFTAAEEAIKGYEAPDTVDLIPSLLRKYKNLVKLVTDHRESYQTVYKDFLDSVEAAARKADKTDEEVDDLLSAAADSHTPLLARALTFKSQLIGLVEDLEGTRQRFAQDAFQKQQEAETDRRRRVADDAERKREEAELREKNMDIEFKNREREKRLEWEEQQKQSLITLEETERKAKIANEQRLLDIQETQLADQSRLEREKLQLVQEAGMTPEAMATLFPPIPSSSGEAKGHSRSLGVNRPKLNLKEFYGDPLLYNEFIQGFMNTVGLDDELSDVMKHSYLRTLLKGEAAEYVRAYDMTAENYSLVLKRLESRFCKPRLVLKTLMDQIYSMDKRSWSAKTADMHVFFDTFNSSLCRLEALGHKMDDSFTIHQFLCRITPYTVSRELNNLMRHRGLTEDDVNLKIYRELFEEFLLDRDRLDYQSGAWDKKADTEHTESPSGKKGRGGGHHQTSPGSGSTLATGTKELQEARQRPPQKSRFCCHYCGERDHYSDQCSKFQDLRSRREKLKERNRCPTCTRPEHEAPCKMMHCYHCKKEVTHHRSLCPEKFKEVSGNYSTTTVGLSTTTPRHHSAKSGDSDWPSEVHLQTAITVLRKSGVAKSKVQCRVLLDQCSDKSYISAEVAKKLKLKSLSKRRLAVYKLRSTEPDVIDTDRVKFEMKLIDGTYMAVHGPHNLSCDRPHSEIPSEP